MVVAGTVGIEADRTGVGAEPHLLHAAAVEKEQVPRLACYTAIIDRTCAATERTACRKEREILKKCFDLLMRFILFQ